MKELSHFAIGFQMALGVLGQQSASRIEMSVLANAGEDIEHFASVGFRILDAVRRDNRQAMRPRKIDKVPVQLFLPANEMPLDFDENIFASERVDQNPRAIFCILGSARAPACNARRLAERN